MIDVSPSPILKEDGGKSSPENTEASLASDDLQATLQRLNLNDMPLTSSVSALANDEEKGVETEKLNSATDDLDLEVDPDVSPFTHDESIDPETDAPAETSTSAEIEAYSETETAVEVEAPAEIETPAEVKASAETEAASETFKKPDTQTGKSEEMVPTTSKSAIINETLLYRKEKVDQMCIEDHHFDFCSKHFGLAAQKLPIFCRNLLVNIKEQTELLPKDSQLRDKYVDEILACIRRQYRDARLELYGSSRNGFGTGSSDLDICMTFTGDWEPTCPEDTRQIIRKVSKLLYSVDHLTDINPLLFAKVPIVKFSSLKYGLETDLSLYNVLAKRNTKMLYRYSQIDERVRTLGYAAKEFVKNCGIGDASRGSLSSYTYVIMMIYYLQQCDPPVLPVLQQLHQGDVSPEIIVEDWNTWFYSENNEQLKQDWEGFGKNESTVSQLWLGFFDFYAQKFDFKTNVVSIRQLEKMSKFEKLWNSDTLAVEDPFDLKRNLGGALTKRMNSYILSTFVKARTAFHASVETLNSMPASSRPTVYNYFFRHKDLPSGGGEKAPQTYKAKTCHICNQKGHFALACPEKAASKERRKAVGNDRQQKLLEMRQAEDMKAAKVEKQRE
ncbi:ZCCHC11 [Bugula neritina]|uniref:ZCCHC11 n=1 Tax=Bugula neritina TaxID=10212 RepID=A0A7J7JRL8_BUGNE|nr:ZCCHC11 [Bugula neritina]